MARKAWAEMTHTERLAECATTKAQVERVLVEVDVFCETAKTLVRSFMPIGLGEHFRQEEQTLIAALEDVPERFKAAIRKAQKEHGWAKR